MLFEYERFEFKLFLSFAVNLYWHIKEKVEGPSIKEE